MPLKDKCFPKVMPSLIVLKVSIPYETCKMKPQKNREEKPSNGTYDILVRLDDGSSVN